VVVTLACVLTLGCSPDPGQGSTEEPVTGRERDGSVGDASAEIQDAGQADADAAFDFPDFGVDAGGGGSAAPGPRKPPTQVPASWSCRPDFALDLVCDCGCAAPDLGCAVAGCSDPGCDVPGCESCFGPDGRREPCGTTGAFLCPLSRRGDGVCDCGCGAADPDCGGAGCDAWGCNVAGCERCLLADGSFGPCPAPAAFECEPGAQSNGQCDCGCGNLDPECQARACTEPGCTAVACELCHAEGGAPIACPPPPAGWWCAADARDDGVCDCGCGAADPDCGGAGCSDGACDAEVCERCHDEFGRSLPCAAHFTCGDEAYADGALCDCGCGAADPDCGGAGCAEPDCTEAACQVRHDAAGQAIHPAEWTCASAAFDAADGCDCGCGATDPDCRAQQGGCSALGCADASCDRCHLAGDALRSCRFQCELTHYASGDGCDCGCGDADPDCGQLGCTEPGCFAPACELCSDGQSEPATCERSACDASVWNDGVCDCGCREEDPDCAGLDSCLSPGCSRTSCERCHDASGQTSVCEDFYCTFEQQGGGDGCNCGCGAEDPDCGGAGCAAPGCVAEACVTCRTWDSAPMSCAP
jgi:hypothetical protein